MLMKESANNFGYCGKVFLIPPTRTVTFSPSLIAIAALVHTSSTVVDAVLTAMLEMRKDPQGQQLLNTISFYQGFEPAQNGDWDDVRSLSINGLNSKEN